jgi:tetratricopeptide (TPR) repeat protein
MTVLRLYFLLSICLGLLLSPYSAMAQYNEETVQPFDIQYGFDPDAKSFSAVADAVYWEKLASAALSNADQATARDNYGKALDLVNEAIRLDPRSAFLYTKLADLSMTLDNYEKAKSAVETALELDPASANAHFLSGLLKYRKEQDKLNALAEFKKAAELNPDHPKAQLLLASLAYEFADYRLAANAYAHVVKLRPYDPEYRYKLGVSYSEYGDIDKAIEELKIAVMLDDSNLDAHFKLAHLYAEQSRNKEAIEECLIVIKRVPQFVDTYSLLAQLYIAEGKYDETISTCQEILKRKSSLKDPSIIADTYLKLGIAYKEKRDKKQADQNFDNSIELYKNVMKDNAENVDINYDIAMVYDAKGDFEMTKNYLGRLIMLKPDNANAYNYLGYLLVERGENMDMAIEYIQKALSLEPDNGAFRDSLGWAYFKMGRLDEAIIELEKSAELVPNDSEVHEHLGEAYLKKGGEFTQKAVQEWEKALELKPSKTALRQKLNDLNIKLNSNTDVGNNKDSK